MYVVHDIYYYYILSNSQKTTSNLQNFLHSTFENVFILNFVLIIYIIGKEKFIKLKSKIFFIMLIKVYFYFQFLELQKVLQQFFFYKIFAILLTNVRIFDQSSLSFSRNTSISSYYELYYSSALRKSKCLNTPWITSRL